MKFAIIILSLLFTSIMYGQTLTEKLSGINTTKQAKSFIAKNQQYEGKLFQIDSKVDTSSFHQQFYSKNTGDIFTIETNTYKIITENSTDMSRVSYLILDGTKLAYKKIEPLRKFILNEYNKGVPFDSLVAKYSMDANKDFGDTDWFADGVMAKEFEDAVRQHKLLEVFTVDVPASHWYFVVKKTYETKKLKQMTILQLKSGE